MICGTVACTNQAVWWIRIQSLHSLTALCNTHTEEYIVALLPLPLTNGIRLERCNHDEQENETQAQEKS